MQIRFNLIIVVVFGKNIILFSELCNCSHRNFILFLKQWVSCCKTCKQNGLVLSPSRFNCLLLKSEVVDLLKNLFMFALSCPIHILVLLLLNFALKAIYWQFSLIEAKKKPFSNRKINNNGTELQGYSSTYLPIKPHYRWKKQQVPVDVLTNCWRFSRIFVSLRL